MENTSGVRVRFAPSPTGFMHLGNVRTALFNYLFARQKKGTCILRIEDTDPDRNFDPGAVKIQEDLKWLGITFDEGPTQGGHYGPYAQSQRTALYQEKLRELQEKNAIYRCFCTVEELEKKRQRAESLRLPPRYDRTCLHLSPEAIRHNLEAGNLYVWRFKIPEGHHQAPVHDMAHGKIVFDLHNFSDFPLTRSDGSFTFIFSNCVDDIQMKITHVLRGEDHLSNTANQIALYQAFKAPIPLFWHLPIIVNSTGKKLSKRDFGFALHDLQQGGFLPEAINNYLALIGGSFSHEIMSLQELIDTFPFDTIHATGNSKYDLEKLRWVNHAWIQKYELADLLALVKPLLVAAYPAAQKLSDSVVEKVVTVVKTELTVLADIIPATHFYFEEPTISQEMLLDHIPAPAQQRCKELVREQLTELAQPPTCLAVAKSLAQKLDLKPAVIFTVLRLAITGSKKGPALPDVIELLTEEVVQRRLEKLYR